jgi:hypothetical protein
MPSYSLFVLFFFGSDVHLVDGTFIIYALVPGVCGIQSLLLASHGESHWKEHPT